MNNTHNTPYTMNPIEQTFAGTTVDTRAVREYLHQDPGYLQACSVVLGNTHMKTVSNHADYFEFHLKRYLLRGVKTLHRVLYEARRFVDFDKRTAQTMMLHILREQLKTLLRNEWYEIMPRLEHARAQVKQLLLQ